MKKLVALLLAALMLLTALPVLAENTFGGWTLIDTMTDYNTEASADADNAFRKAMAAWNGDPMELVMPLACQVVAGTNYCVLAIANGNTAPAWKLVNLYNDPMGNVSVSAVRDLGHQPVNGMAGGWQIAMDTEDEYNEEAIATEERLWTALEQAENGTVPYGFVLLNTQVVAGTNYELLCWCAQPVSSTGSDDDAELVESGLALAEVYLDLNGGATLTRFEPISLGVN